MTVFRWLVSGRVQGVAFRWFTAETAHAMSLRGTVRNLPDGRVEILVVDPGDGSLDAFRAKVHQGPPASRVDDVVEEPVSEAEAAEIGERQGFDIVYR